ncbi:MAG TPA: hypothetical protein VGH28_00025 [Polyangiaceae bacterium]
MRLFRELAALALAVSATACTLWYLADDPYRGLGADGGDAIADVSPIDDAGCDADTQSDPANCGACSHGCLGGACEAGVCQPTQFYAGPGVAEIVANDAYVVFSKGTAAGGGIFQCDVGAVCTATEITGSQAVVIGVDPATPSYTYWTDFPYGEIDRCPLGGCANPVVIFPDASSAFTPIAVGSTKVFAYDGTQVFSCDKNDVDCTYTFQRIAAATTVNGTATDGTRLFWTTGSEVWKCKNANCGAGVVLASDDAGAYGPVAADEATVDGGGVFWADTQRDDIFACNATACTAPTLVATQQKAPVAIAVDDQNVYWIPQPAKNAPASIMRCAKSCDATKDTPVLVAQADITLDTQTLAVNATAIYWIDSDGGIVVLAK